MFKHILIPTDGPALARKAILYGVQLAKESGAKVTGLTVAEPYRAAAMDAVLVPADEGDYEEQSRVLSERAMEQVRMAAQAAGVPCETIREVHDQPYRAIIDAAHALGCDLIVMASHGRRGISALLLGSETVKVLTHSPFRCWSTADLPSSAHSASVNTTPPALSVRPAAAASSARSSLRSASASRPDDEPSMPTASSRSITGAPGAGGGPASLTRAMRRRAVPRCFMRETTSWPT